ncbi:hypothetical protein [Streptomyces sp. C]|uniref:hypothetical protein n=1 Tax=Streptomyces sp. C TaxID=253839 RepID=UPI0001B57D0E|nr:hypothetical protein [Streptomyces sp. C]
MRQRISLLAACGLVAVGLTTPTAMAAESADPVFRLAGQSALALRPYPATGSPQPVAMSFHLEDTGSFGGEFTFTVDRAAVAGIASVKESSAAPQKCVENGTKLVCKDKGPRPGVDLVATAEKGAAERAFGAVKVTGTAAGATVTPAETTLSIGGPDLIMRKLPLKADPKPGESQALPLAFRNEGTQSAKGVILELEATRGLELPERYDNCTYRTGRTSNTVVCTVEGEFEAKATYELAGDSPLHLKAGANALNEWFTYGIFPAEAPKQATDAKAPDAAGAATTAGRKLVARKKAEAAPAPLRAPDLNEADNRRVARFTVDNTADFAAEPLTVKGAAGTTVKAVVGARNNGPAWVANHGSATPAAVVDVVLPQGVKVVTAPAACRAVQPAQYRCATGPVVTENEKLAFPFELKIEKAVKDAKGAITVGGLDAKGEPKRHDFDRVLTNNQAAFTANPTATPTKSPSPSASGSASPSASKSASPSAGSSTGSTTGNNASAAAGGRSGGPLASTGSTAGLVGLAGAGLFAVGAALYLSFRRRGNGGAHA